MIILGKNARESENHCGAGVSQVISSNENEDYTKILTEGYDWNMFYHLSPMRQSLLNWYEFKPNGYALELNGELGALTGVLCDNCKRVASLVPDIQTANLMQKRYERRENLDIYVGNVDEFDFLTKFNVIVDICGLEKIGEGKKKNNLCVEYINHISDLLADDGKLLFVVENRYGVKYFCGAKEKYSNLPFFGINQCFQEKNGHLFHKKELESILDSSVMHKYKFFYPLPDHIVPQIVFTDSYSDSMVVSERLNPYNVEQDSLIANERKLYKDIIDNNALGFMANSFLIECSKKDNLSDVTCSIISTDRNRENSFATCLCEDNKVYRKNLFPEGKKNLSELYYNIKEIAARNISVVPHEMIEANKIMMPNLKESKLSDVLYQKNDESKEEFLELWDKLYDLILASSEHVEQKYNSISKENLDWGVILRKGYIDLVPSNIFVINNDFYVFDQEFVKYNCPAKYILYRGIKYIYMYFNSIEPIIPMEELQMRYHMQDVWEIFEEEESQFIENNRQLKLYEQFYRWTSLNRWKVAKRGEKIGQINV